MLVSILRRFVAILVCVSIAYSPLVVADDLSLPSGDMIAPKVIHKRVTDPLPVGSPLQIKAKVKDNVGVQSVILFYRKIGDTDYKRAALSPTDVEDEYSITLGKDDIAVPGIEYYIQARDLAGNTLLHGYSFSPLKVQIVPLNSIASTQGSDVQSQISPEAVADQQIPKKEKSSNRWIWITLGVLAAGAIAVAASSGGDGGDGGSGGGDSTIVVTAPPPGN
jgi:hypothetical protein